MEVFIIKAGFALIILGITLCGGLPPILIKGQEKYEDFFARGDLLSRGIFLGAGLMHMLPDAMHHAEHIPTLPDYPMVTAMVAATIAILFLIENGISSLYTNHHAIKLSLKAYILVILLSLHSVIAGTALGVESSWATFIAIFIAIIAHKGSEAFALGISIRGSDIKRGTGIKLMLLFALMTPFGIFAGTGLAHYFVGHTGSIIEVVFDSIAAGTFLYIALATKMHPEDELTEHVGELTQAGYFALGLLIMGLVAVWL